MAKSAAKALTSRLCNLDAFAHKQFVAGKSSCFIPDISKDDFAQKVCEIYASGKAALVDGYAPFCKHLFVPNFTEAKVNALEITSENESLMRSGYLARQEGELAVLSRWFPRDAVTAHSAKFLDVILYSREQIKAEQKAMGIADDGATEPWGIISIKPQDVDHELPMQPITMLRNALGKEEGGSGVALERAKYEASVAYWKKHAVIM